MCRYDLQEFPEALDHALSPGRCSKVLLRMPPMNLVVAPSASLPAAQPAVTQRQMKVAETNEKD